MFIDYLTKWPEVFATSDQTSLTIAELLVEHVISRHGVPSELLSDWGTAFLSKLMLDVYKLRKVTQWHTILKQMVWWKGSTIPLQTC